MVGDGAVLVKLLAGGDGDTRAAMDDSLGTGSSINGLSSTPSVSSAVVKIVLHHFS